MHNEDKTLLKEKNIWLATCYMFDLSLISKKIKMKDLELYFQSLIRKQNLTVEVGLSY